MNELTKNQINIENREKLLLFFKMLYTSDLGFKLYGLSNSSKYASFELYGGLDIYFSSTPWRGKNEISLEKFKSITKCS